MCTVSMIGDFYRDRFNEPSYPFTPIDPGIPLPGKPIPALPVNPIPAWPQPSTQIWLTPIGRQEFDDLKKEVETMKALLIKAKIYDEANGEPDCEMEEKIALLKRVAELVGVSLEEVFGK
jgi:hypothetical protein